MQNGILLGGTDDRQIWLDVAMANRHGLITGATGTGKTVTLQLLTYPERQTLLTKRYRPLPAQMRITAHHFANQVIEMLAGEPGIWTDERTGTQLPLSYRDWEGTYDPGELGISLYTQHLWLDAQVAVDLVDHLAVRADLADDEAVLRLAKESTEHLGSVKPALPELTAKTRSGSI